jgi:glutathione peroxidase-family protein
MKILFLYLSSFLLSAPLASSFYDIKFEALDGTLVKTSAYQGKKVIVAVISAGASGDSLVTYLDSVQNANSMIKVIVVPTGDFNGSVDNQKLKDLKKNKNIAVAKPLKVKKSNGSQQHPLFVWLTQSKENRHFDSDVVGEGQVFVVSAKGTLYSVLPAGVPRNILAQVINQSFTE